jgi:hypothetical protein
MSKSAQDSRSIQGAVRPIRVARFSLQGTASFPDGAPQREEYDDDYEFERACWLYAAEWRSEYLCCDEGCADPNCPQHGPNDTRETAVSIAESSYSGSRRLGWSSGGFVGAAAGSPSSPRACWACFASLISAMCSRQLPR